MWSGGCAGPGFEVVGFELGGGRAGAGLCPADGTPRVEVPAALAAAEALGGGAGASSDEGPVTTTGVDAVGAAAAEGAGAGAAGPLGPRATTRATSSAAAAAAPIPIAHRKTPVDGDTRDASPERSVRVFWSGGTGGAAAGRPADAACSLSLEVDVDGPLGDVSISRIHCDRSASVSAASPRTQSPTAVGSAGGQQRSSAAAMS